MPVALLLSLQEPTTIVLPSPDRATARHFRRAPLFHATEAVDKASPQ